MHVIKTMLIINVENARKTNIKHYSKLMLSTLLLIR